MNYFFTTHWQWIVLKSTDDLFFDLKSGKTAVGPPLLFFFLCLQQLCRRKWRWIVSIFTFQFIEFYWWLMHPFRIFRWIDRYLCHRETTYSPERHLEQMLRQFVFDNDISLIFALNIDLVCNRCSAESNVVSRSMIHLIN